MFLSPLSDDFNTITKFSHRLFLSKIWKKNKILRWISFGCWVLEVNTMLMGRCLWKHSQSHRIFLVYIYTPSKKNFIVQKMKGEKEKSQARRSSLTPHQQEERWAFLVVYSIPVSSCTKSGLQRTHLLCTTVINVCLQEKRTKGETREKITKYDRTRDTFG